MIKEDQVFLLKGDRKGSKEGEREMEGETGERGSITARAPGRCADGRQSGCAARGDEPAGLLWRAGHNSKQQWAACPFHAGEPFPCSGCGRAIGAAVELQAVLCSDDLPRGRTGADEQNRGEKKTRKGGGPG